MNWENPNVRCNVYDMMTWWLEKGIDGFRMDVINALSKDQRFQDGERLPANSAFPGWMSLKTARASMSFCSK